MVIRRGGLASHGFREGYVPGGEVAGTVTSVGDGVDASWGGRRVWAAIGTSGGYAEHALAPVSDVVAGADLPSFLGRLNPNGRTVVVGAVGGQPPADFGTAIMAAFRKSLSFATFSAATVSESDRRAVRTAQFAAAARGEPLAVAHQRLPLEEAALAHQRMDAGEVFGRIVLIP